MKIKPNFLQKIKFKKLNCCLLQFLFGALKVKMSGYNKYFSPFFTGLQLLTYHLLPFDDKTLPKRGHLLGEQILSFMSNPRLKRREAITNTAELP